MTFHWNIRPDTDEWHSIRQKHVGGSEIPGLLGVQEDWGLSAYTLWAVKSGLIPPPPLDDAPGSLIWHGKRLEPIIGALAAELRQWEIQPGPYVTDDECPGMGASLDFIIKAPGPLEHQLGFSGPGVLQTKNVHMIAHLRKWSSDEPPPSVILQLQHEIACTGYEWGAIACLEGGTETRVYPYRASTKLAQGIREKVTDFWRGVAEKKAPQIDASDSTLRAIQALYPQQIDEFPVDLTGNNEIEEICNGFLVAQADFKGAEKNLSAWKNRLFGVMQGHKRAVCVGYEINGVFTPENPGRPAVPGEIIGARRASSYYKVKERVGE